MEVAQVQFQNLGDRNISRFFSVKELYQSCNFGCFRLIHVNVKPTCCTLQHFCMTFRNILDFYFFLFSMMKNVCKINNELRYHLDMLSCIILDEAHKQNLNTHMLFGLELWLVAKLNIIRTLTDIGRKMVEFLLDPSLSKMLCILE